jgi:hypothetical protein
VSSVRLLRDRLTFLRSGCAPTTLPPFLRSAATGVWRRCLQSGGERRMVKVVARPPETRAGTAKRRRSPPLEFQTDVSCVSVSPRPWGCDETRHLRRLAPRGFHDPGPAINRRFRKLRPKRRVRCSRDRDLTARVAAPNAVTLSPRSPRCDGPLQSRV